MPDLQPITRLPNPPARPVDGHKGTFGTVIVVGGCPTMFGAPALCAGAVLRAGAGLVKVAADAALIPHVLTIEPSATGIALAGSAAQRVAQIESASPDHAAVLAVGPGLGEADDLDALIPALLALPWRGIVLDADGLNAVARLGYRHPKNACPLVLTPHPGEFRRLAEPAKITADPTDLEQRPRAAAELAAFHHGVVVLKGQHTAVTDACRLYLNTTGNPALATAGTGDVLTGLIAGLLAQHMPPLDAATLATHLHGRAADQWAERYGPSSLTARDLLTLLPAALHSVRSE